VSDPPGHDPARQAALLTSQVKLLLKTEQRLLRSQRQIETQVRRLQALSTFALLAPRSYSAGDTVAHTLDLLWPIFSVQAAVAMVRPPRREGPPAQLVRRADGPLLPAPSTRAEADPAWSTWPAGIVVLEPGEDAAELGPLLALIDDLAPPDGWEARARWRRCLVLPLGDGPRPDGHGALLLCRCAATSRTDTPASADLSFLELVRSHGSAAIAIAALNAEQEARVEARTLDLAAANEQLRLSLDGLRQAQSRLLEASRLAATAQLAAAVAHEVNNPLSALKANVAWLAQGPGGARPSGERAEVLADSLAAIGRISLSVARLRELAAPAKPGE